MDAQKWPYGSCFGAPELDFAAFLHVFFASNGLDLRFSRNFTWYFMAGVDWSRHFVVNYVVFYGLGSLESPFCRKLRSLLWPG